MKFSNIALLTVPIFFSVLGGAAAALTGLAFEMPNFQSLLIGFAVFTAILALGAYILLVIFTRTNARLIQDLRSFENNIIQKLKQRPSGENVADFLRFEKRMAHLEQQLENREELQALAPGFSDSVGSSSGDHEMVASRSLPDDPKVVKLTSARVKREMNIRDSKFNRNAEAAAHQPPSQKNEKLELYLQPIIDIVSRQPVAVEVYGCFEDHAGRQIKCDDAKLFSSSQIVANQLQMLHLISQLVRTMAMEDEIVPVYFGFVPALIKNEQAWREVCLLLDKDIKLARLLVPQLSLADFERLDPIDLQRFLNLRELGIDLCFADCATPAQFRNAISGLEFKQIKISAADLLRYQPADQDRLIDIVLPAAKISNVKVIVSGIVEDHQMANLLDYDLTWLQGDLLHPRQKIGHILPGATLDEVIS